MSMSGLCNANVMSMPGQCKHSMSLECSSEGHWRSIATWCRSPNANSKKRLRRDEMQQMRTSMHISDVELPTTGRFECATVSMARPAHPCDDITWLLEEAHVAFAIGFIAAHAVSIDDLLEERADGTNGVKGVWKFKRHSSSGNPRLKAPATLVFVSRQRRLHPGLKIWWS